MPDNLGDDSREPGSRVLFSYPATSLFKVLVARRESEKILEVDAGHPNVIGCRVELEIDQVVPADYSNP
jgi:hypothetical protein